MLKIQGYIIEKYSNMGSAYTCRRLLEEAALRDMDVRLIGVRDVNVIGDKVYEQGQELPVADFVINRYKWGKIKHAIAMLGKKQYNSQTAFECYINKYEQLRMLQSDAFLFPRYCLSVLPDSVEQVREVVGLPFVAKGLENSQGREVYLIDSNEALEQLRSEYPEDKEWLLEEYIRESYGRDIRFYSIRGEVVACMTREAKEGFRANVALGGSVKEYPITEEIRQVAKDIYAQTGLDFLGIDLLFGTDKPYFCEINVMPGIEGIERACNVNVAGRIMDVIKEDCRI